MRIIDYIIELKSVPQKMKLLYKFRIIKKNSIFLFHFQNALPSASNFLFNALDGRAYIDSVIVMIPSSWPKNCLPQNGTLLTSRGESSDITISERHPIYGDAIWTQQSAGK